MQVPTNNANDRNEKSSFIVSDDIDFQTNNLKNPSSIGDEIGPIGSESHIQTG